MSDRRHADGRQRGVALLVVMVVLFALSVLGITSMRDASLEQSMVTNSAIAASAFQAAESATDEVLNDAANLTAAWGVPGNSVTHDDIAGTPDGFAVEADLVYLGEGPAPGYSLGQNGSGFVSLRFDVRGAAALDSLNARARVGQSAYRVAPSN